MDRRKFLQTGLVGTGMLGLVRKDIRAQDGRRSVRPTGRLPGVAIRQLTAPNPGFPSVTPLFSGVFLPGTGAGPLIMSDSWADFSAQVQTQANAGYRLACLTTIQNFNRTFYYGVCRSGSGAWKLQQFSDEPSFYAAFQSYQNGYYLADFNISFQAGQLSYYGYWLAGTKSQSMLRALSYLDLRTQWDTLSTAAQSPQQMTRVQAYPLDDASTYHALFEAGGGAYPFHQWPVYQNVTANVPSDESFAAQVAIVTTNSLAGVCYEPVSGSLAGCWGALANGAQYFQDLEFGALSSMAQSNAANLVLSALTVYPDAPDWDDYFEANLAPYVMGYAYAVAQNGQTILTGGGGFARGPNESANPSMPFTVDSRMNLASVSKAVTGVALELFVSQNAGQSLDAKFLPVVMPKLTETPQPAAAAVNLANLAAMETGLFQYPLDAVGSTEGPPDITSSVGPFGPYKSTWADISDYLAQPPNYPAAPGTTYDYNNTNYAILQGYIELALNPDATDPTGYTAWVTDNVITPVGMAEFSPMPDPKDIATLAYAGPNDSEPGYYRQQITLVGASGWIGSVRQLIKLMNALRGPTLLSPSTVTSMFSSAIGAWVEEAGTFGPIYYKDGDLSQTEGTLTQGVHAGLIRLPEGYDVAIVANSAPPIGVREIAIDAYQARGLSTANIPPGPIVAAAVNAASYQPNIAPGGFVAVFGSSLATATTDWSNSIEGGVLPIELAGVRVRVGGEWAAISYASAKQINFILPSTIAPGTLNLEVSTPLGGMTPVVTVAALAPGLFTIPVNSVNYAAAVFAGDSGVVYVGPPGSVPGEITRPAKAGDYVELYGTGMGPTLSPAPDGVVLTQDYPGNTANFSVTIGGQAATVLFAGLVFPGVFQINIQVPQGVPAGDQPLVVSVSQISSQANVMMTMA